MSDLINGKSNYLFLAGNENAVIRQHTGDRLLNERQLTKWVNVIQNRKIYLDKNSINYYLQVIPDKHAVYTQFLPDDIIFAKRRNIDLFLEAVSPVLQTRLNYPLDVIKAESTQHQVYFKWDSHWTDRGAYIAYLELMKIIQEDLHELYIIDNPVFTPGTFQGDLARMAEIETEEPTEFFNQIETVDIAFDNKVKNTGRIKIFTNSSARNNLTLLVFGSSSTLFTLKYLNQDFSKVIFYWSGNFDYSPIMHYKPDIIINQVRERHLIRPADDVIGLNTVEMAFVKSFITSGEAISPITFNKKAALVSCLAKIGNKSNQAYRNYLKVLCDRLHLKDIYQFAITINRNRYSYQAITIMLKIKLFTNQFYFGSLTSRLKKIVSSNSLSD